MYMPFKTYRNDAPEPSLATPHDLSDVKSPQTANFYKGQNAMQGVYRIKLLTKLEML